MLGTLGWQELLIILVIVALLFGASRVASLGGALGRGIREFRSEATGGKKDDDQPEEEETVQDTARDTGRDAAAPASSEDKPRSANG